jgi:hypothetical protein
MAHSILLSAAQVALYINGNQFGRVNGFTYSVDTPRKRLATVDSLIPFELATGQTHITGNMTIYRTALDGAAEGPGMVAPIDELPREKYFSIVLVDLTTQVVIFQADFCSVEQQSWSINSKGLVMGTVAWSALSYQNEVRPLGDGLDPQRGQNIFTR